MEVMSDELRNILMKFEMPELVNKLKDFGFKSTQSLLYITETDLNEIFAEKSELGLKIEFRYKLQRWRNRNAHFHRKAEPISSNEPLSSFRELSNQRDCLSRIENMLLAENAETEDYSSKMIRNLKICRLLEEETLRQIENTSKEMRSMIHQTTNSHKESFQRIVKLLNKMEAASTEAEESLKGAYETIKKIKASTTALEIRNQQTPDSSSKTTDNVPPSTSQLQDISQLQADNTMQKFSPSSCATSLTTKNSEEQYSIEVFLSKNPLFVSQFSGDENQTTLTKAGRKHIAGSAIEFFANRVDSVGVSEFEHVANEIRSRFAKEKIKTYYSFFVGLYDGLLYSAARETSLKIRRDRPPNPNLFKFTNDETLARNPQILEWKNWLKYNSEPEEVFKDLWLKTRDARLMELTKKPWYKTLNLEWPAYQRNAALISQDFEHFMVCNTNGLIDNWDSFVVQFRAKAASLIKDKTTLNKLKSNFLDEISNKDLRDAAIFDLLAAVLPSTCQPKNTKDGTYWRINLKEAQEFFIIRTGNVQWSTMEMRVELQDYNMQLQPLIAIEGEGNNLQYLGIFCGEEYVFDSLLEAVSNMFKFYILFNIEYMRPCSFIWQFIQRYFFHIESRPCSTRVQKVLEHFGYEKP